LTPLLGAQEQISVESAAPPAAANMSISSVYVIEEISYDITGATREHSIRIVTGLKTGERFSSLQELERYVERKKLLLQNQRVFESSDITYTLSSSPGTGIVQVSLLVTTKDTWNIIGLPYPKYSSTDGFEFKLKLKHYNFFGSMQPLNTDILYRFDENRNHVIGGNIDFIIPFNAWGTNASWSFNTGIEWPIGEKPYITFNSGIIFSIPFDRMSIDIGVTQGITAFERDDDDAIYQGDELYFTEKVSLSMPFVITTIYGWGDLNWAPSVSFTYNWDADGIGNEDLKSPVVSFGHGISGGQINWNENFRSGFSFSFTNNYSINYGKDNLLHPALEGILQFFLSSSYVGFNSRLQWFALLSTDTQDIRDTVRGIQQKTEVESAFLLNLDLPVRLFRTNWRAFAAWATGNEVRPGTSILDFELQIAPFVDIAFIHDEDTDRWYHPQDALFSGGIEILIFPLRMRSIQGRISAGQNIRELLKSPDNLLSLGKYDIFIGIGLHY
jgi:hypothetical protein